MAGNTATSSGPSDTVDTPSRGPDTCCRHSRSEVIKILLIRHAETIDNVHHNYAGTTDSPLTSHGVLQARALGSSLIKDGHYISHIASSCLQRAYQTATAIRQAALQAIANQEDWNLSVDRRKELSERDFGALEGKNYLDTPSRAKRPKYDRTSFFRPRDRPQTPHPPVSIPQFHGNDTSAGEAESHESMASRANTFIDSYLLPIINGPRTPLIAPSTISDLLDYPATQHVKTVAIVSHGIFLSVLFRELLSRFRITTVSSEALEAGYTYGKVSPRWENTGYALLHLHSLAYTGTPSTSSPTRSSVTYHNPAAHSNQPQQLAHELIIQSINVKTHLSNLKRTGGGIGSARADPHQRTMMEYFKSKTAKSVAPPIKREHESVEEQDPAWMLPPPLPAAPSVSRNSTVFGGFGSSFTDASSEYFPSSPPQSDDDPTMHATITSFV
ncbi:histidine phosphatase superfamily [Kalaharituber pfeilii]|nr:histidine phosphatase superfamily [Kalaharituber pfeilii]